MLTFLMLKVFVMKVFRFLGLAVVFLGAFVKAEVVTRDGLSGVLQTNLALATALGRSISLEELGEGQVLGQERGNLAGRTVGPYVFNGYINGLSRAEGRVEVVLETRVAFADAEGREVRGDRIQGGTRDLTLVESLLSYRVRPDLRERDRYEWSEGRLPLSEDERGVIRRGELEGRLRIVEVEYTDGQDQWYFEVKYDVEGRPEEVLGKSTVVPVEGVVGGTLASVSQTAFYREGNFVKAMSDDKKLLSPAELAAGRVYQNAVRLATASDEKMVELLEEAITGQVRFLERPVTADYRNWKPVALEGASGHMDFRQTAKEAALAWGRELRLIPLEDHEEQPAYLWTDVVAQTGKVVIVLVTANGLSDDRLEAERFLLTLQHGADGWALTRAGKQQKEWTSVGWR